MNYPDLKSLLSSDDAEKIIKVLTSQAKEIDIGLLKKQYDPSQHPVFDKNLRPTKMVKNEEGQSVPEDPTRLAFPMQEYIVKKSISFMFGHEVEIVCNSDDEKEQAVLRAMKRINKDTKIHALNWDVAEYLLKSEQVAEIWYSEETNEEHSTYGFKTKFKVKSSAFSPWDGDELFPYFDHKKDLIAFSRRYSFSDGDEKTTHFEIFTKEEYILLAQSEKEASQWNITRSKNPIKKIQVIYAEDDAEWKKVQWHIERLEFLLSNFSDTNDYNGAPIAFATGEISSLPSKISTGKVIQGAPGADFKYVTWTGAPEQIKTEIETHFRVIHTYTQTPDISFENIKGIGAISGVALEMFFMDAHLKVMDKRRIFDPYLQRRINIQKEFIIAMNLDLKDAARNMDIECIIKPYMIDDIAGRVQWISSAVNSGIMSKETGVSLLAATEDPDAELERILAEEKLRREESVFGPNFS